MNQWTGRTAVVTGASSGIGAAIVIDLLRCGVNVVGLARRKELIDELEKSPRLQDAPAPVGKLHAFKCDITKEEQIKEVFKWIEENLGGVDIMVNNAGIIKHMNLFDADNTAALRETIDTNIMAVAFCSREAFLSMRKREIQGHIIHINSYAGHRIPFFAGIFPSFNIYPSTKYAVTAMTEVMRQEALAFGTRIKVTSISPGAVKTGIFAGELEEVIRRVTYLEPEDVSQAVMYALSTGPKVQVHELIIKPVGEKA